MTTQVPYLYISFYACRQVQAKQGNGMHTMTTQVPYLYISFYACIAFRQCYNTTGNRLHRFQLSYESFYMGPKQITNTTPAADLGGGGGAMAPPFQKKNLRAYCLTISNPALAILLSSSRLEDIRGATLRLGTLQIMHTNNSQTHPLAARTLLHQQSAKCNWNLYYQNLH